jgi:superfamily II DNA or RNA helicase
MRVFAHLHVPSYWGDAGSIDGVAEEIESIFLGRFRAVKGEGWSLRYLHRVGLRSFVREILEKGECRKIVQMPTGAGKSVLLSLLALAAVHLRGHIREGGRRNIVLVFSPLTRIKFQLFEPLAIASGAREEFKQPSFFVYCISSDAKALAPLRTELARHGIKGRWVGDGVLLALASTSIPLRGTCSLSDALSMIVDRAGRSGNEYNHVLMLCPHALKKLKHTKHLSTVERQLRSRVLAVFIDEAHVMVGLRHKLGSLMAQLAKSAPVALGFTATPVRETCTTVAGKPCSHDLLLHGEPILSYDLMRKRKWIEPNEQPVLVDYLVARFYRSNFHLLRAPAQLRGKHDLWRGSCYDRVREYAERMLDELEKHFGLNRYALPRSVKVLVLAPNTREADIWGEVLREKLRSAEHIFVAHSNVPDPHGEIERFVRSRSGFLVAVDMAKLGFDDPDLDALVIARPVRSTAAYVQMRGRVLRYPRSKDRPKLRRGALVLHLAAKGIMEAENEVMKVESGGLPRVQLGDLEGYGGGAVEFSAKVETLLLGERRVGAPPTPQPAEEALPQGTPQLSAAEEPQATAEGAIREQPEKSDAQLLLRRFLSLLRQLAARLKAALTRLFSLLSS